jgi:hypothetical protein
MAFDAVARSLPNNPRSVGGFVTRTWDYTNTTSGTGGAVDTGFAYIHSAAVTIDNSEAATVAQIVIAAPNVTITVVDQADGVLTVTGRGVT